MNNQSYLELLQRRPVVFDGAMGTSVQSLNPSADDFGGEAFLGCNDHLVISSPHLIREIHASFLEVGCDVLETDTFRANPFSLREYGLQEEVEALNRTAASLAGEVAREYATPSAPRFVAGSMGPSGFLPSSSDPDLGRISWAELSSGYTRQAAGLLAGGVDLLLIETGQDILEVKAAVSGARAAMETEGRRVPLQVQVTLDTSGRMLLGTDAFSALVTLEALGVDVLGLNCSTGPEHMREPVRILTRHGRTPVSVIPNAGIPHNDGGVAVYPLSPESLARALREFVAEMGVAVVGGCCGTTPEHLSAVVEGLGKGRRRTSPPVLRVSSAVKAVDLRQIPAPTIIGERVNAQGSRRVKELLLREDYQGVLQVARDQVEGGAHLLDVCVAMTERTDEARQMVEVVKLLSQGVEAPLVVDTTEVEVAVAALRQIPGRAVVNSINLEGGREKMDRLLPHVVEHGAAVVALTIDEEGMAGTRARKLEVARRIHRICVDEYGLDPGSLIFDSLTFTLATGEEAYRDSALETIWAIGDIRRELPGVLTSLGVSNVSFGLPPQARPVVNSVFLHHAVEAGLNLAILNPAHLTPLQEMEPEALALAEALVLNRRRDALPELIEHFQRRGPAGVREKEDPMDGMTPPEAIHWMILHRRGDGVEGRVEEEVQRRGGGHRGAVDTLNHVLLPAMKEVGDRFASGDLILPFVLQSAEVMKAAVTRLEDFLERKEGQSKGTVVLATVLGDVHDIGKNLVHTILENNGYTVHNLGKQVPVNTILDQAQALEADAIGLSALLVSTSKQMPLCVEELNRRGLEIPVLLGGAAINPTFVRKAAEVGEGGELYPFGVFYCKDAFDGLTVLERLQDPEGRDAFLARWARDVTEASERRRALQATVPDRAPAGLRPPPSGDVEIPAPPFWGTRVLERLPLEELIPLVDRNTLYRLHWGARNAGGETLEALIDQEFEPRFQRFRQQALAGGGFRVRAAYGFFPAGAEGDDLVLFQPGAPGVELARFPFPRQRDREELCLSDFFLPVNGVGSANRVGGGKAEDPPGVELSPRTGGREDTAPGDVAALQVVTVDGPVLKESAGLMEGGAYAEGYFLHGFGVRLAEAGAEFLHRRIRRELGISQGRGLRYSWGYGACPDPRQHEAVFRLLPCRERLGMELTEAGALVPELSTAALVVHHPQARYFHV